MKTSRTSAGFAALAVSLCASAAYAQEFRVQGNNTSTYDVMQSNNTATNTQDRIAVHGTSAPAPYWGIGGKFEGGFIGTYGLASVSGTGSRYGGYFYSYGGSSANYGIYASAPTGTGNYAGYFSGDVYVSGTLTQASDLRLKTSIKDIANGVLSQVLQLKPKTYRYVAAAAPSLSLPDGDQVGFIAQDVAAVFPQLVKQTTVASPDKTKPADTFLSLDYVKMVPLLVKAIQEQQAQIDALTAQVAALSKH